MILIVATCFKTLDHLPQVARHALFDPKQTMKMLGHDLLADDLDLWIEPRYRFPAVGNGLPHLTQLAMS